MQLSFKSLHVRKKLISKSFVRTWMSLQRCTYIYTAGIICPQVFTSFWYMVQTLICKHFNLIPIGKLTEEVSEARNKAFRTFRQNFSRKIGRKQKMEDILHNLLISSDPLISSIRRKYSWKENFSLYPEAQELLDDMDMMEVEDEDNDSY